MGNVPQLPRPLPQSTWPKVFWDGESIRLSLTQEEASKLGFFLTQNHIVLHWWQERLNTACAVYSLPSEINLAILSVVVSIQPSVTQQGSPVVHSQQTQRQEGLPESSSGESQSASPTGNTTPFGEQLEMNENIDPFFVGTKSPVIP